MRLRISLVMATLGRTVEIERFVNCLATQTRRDFELIVVDQNPDDRLAPVVARARSLGLQCLHLRQSEPNLCSARNTGIVHAKGDIVAFPDDDCWYEAEVVEKVLSRFERRMELDGLVIRWFEVGHPSAGRLSFHNFARFRSPPASSITLFIRAGCLRAVGGFDDRLGLHSWYGSAEETDLLFHLLRRNAEIEFEPEASVHHATGTPSGFPPAEIFERARGRARGTGALYARHPLPIWVIARGLLSPWLRIPTQPANLRAAAQNLGLGLGRLEGFLGWRFGYRVENKKT